MFACWAFAFLVFSFFLDLFTSPRFIKNQKGIFEAQEGQGGHWVQRFENQKAAQNLKRPALLRCSNIPFDKFNEKQDALRTSNKTN